MSFLRDEQGRLIRKDGSLVEGAQAGRHKGRGGRSSGAAAGRGATGSPAACRICGWT